jgi:hypothetical protein
MSTRTPIGHDLLERLAELEAVDGPAKMLADAAEPIRSRALHLNQRTGVTWQRSRRSACSAPG